MFSVVANLVDPAQTQVSRRNVIPVVETKARHCNLVFAVAIQDNRSRGSLTQRKVEVVVAILNVPAQSRLWSAVSGEFAMAGLQGSGRRLDGGGLA
jgi:hypothetical protein